MSDLRIGLVGAPGSGKFDIAMAAARFSPQHLYVSRNGGTRVADLGQAVGAHGSFREDYWALFETISGEASASQLGEDYILCGTVWECLAHASVNLETLHFGIQTPQVEEEIALRTASLAMLTILVLQNFNCNYVFRVPYPKTKPVDVDEFDWLYGRKIDVALDAILDMQGLRLQRLAPGAPGDQAQEMMDKIHGG